MPDARVQCRVEPSDKPSDAANAFRAVPDGDEVLLDFINCPDEVQGEVVARLRVHRSVLKAICGRITNSMQQPKMELVSGV